MSSPDNAGTQQLGGPSGMGTGVLDAALSNPDPATSGESGDADQDEGAASDLDPGSTLEKGLESHKDDEAPDEQAENADEEVEEGQEVEGDDLDGDDDTDETETDEETEEGTDSEEEEGDEGEGADDDDDAESYEADYLYENDEGEEVFLEAGDQDEGQYSVYHSREDAEQGLQRQLDYIEELETERDELKDATSDQISELESELEMYRRGAGNDNAKEMLIRGEMPEELATLDPDQITDDDEYRRYRRARIDAEARVDKQIENRKAEREAQEGQREEAETRVEEMVRDYDSLGIRNTEDKREAQKRFSEETESGSTLQQVAEDLAFTYGEEAAQSFVQGVVSDLQRQRQKKTVEGAKEAKKKGPKIRTKKRKKKTRKTLSDDDRNADSILSSALEQGS